MLLLRNQIGCGRLKDLISCYNTILNVFHKNIRLKLIGCSFLLIILLSRCLFTTTIELETSRLTLVRWTSIVSEFLIHVPKSLLRATFWNPGPTAIYYVSKVSNDNTFLVHFDTNYSIFINYYIQQGYGISNDFRETKDRIRSKSK